MTKKPIDYTCWSERELIEEIERLGALIASMTEVRGTALSTVQQEALENPCPNCNLGKLSAINNTESDEVYLWCDTCSLTMDSSGGYTN